MHLCRGVLFKALSQGTDAFLNMFHAYKLYGVKESLTKMF